MSDATKPTTNDAIADLAPANDADVKGGIILQKNSTDAAPPERSLLGGGVIVTAAPPERY